MFGGQMIEATTGKKLFSIKNPAFRSYVRMYADIEHDFLRTIDSYGLPLADESEDVTHGALAARVDELGRRGALVENDRKSIHLNWISPACLTCRKGVGTETYLTSTQCPRNCFFCFNPNQERYEYYLSHEHDVCAELRARHKSGVRYRDLALTGGELLLHPDLTVSFFKLARKLYPDAYTRLYTSGWNLDDTLIARLQKTGLSEIRFSVKLEESQQSIKGISPCALRASPSSRGAKPCGPCRRVRSRHAMRSRFGPCGRGNRGRSGLCRQSYGA